MRRGLPREPDGLGGNGGKEKERKREAVIEGRQVYREGGTEGGIEGGHRGGRKEGSKGGVLESKCLIYTCRCMYTSIYMYMYSVPNKVPGYSVYDGGKYQVHSCAVFS